MKKIERKGFRNRIFREKGITIPEYDDSSNYNSEGKRKSFCKVSLRERLSVKTGKSGVTSPNITLRSPSKMLTLSSPNSVLSKTERINRNINVRMVNSQPEE